MLNMKIYFSLDACHRCIFSNNYQALEGGDYGSHLHYRTGQSLRLCKGFFFATFYFHYIHFIHVMQHSKLKVISSIF